MKEFFEKNKVLILGGLSSIGVALSAFLGQPEIDLKVLGFAVITAVLSYLANTLRGQWVSIIGILGTLLTTYMTQAQTGTITWNQLILQAIVAFITVIAPPAKPLGYEKSAVIETAKAEGQAIQNKIEETPPPQL